MQPLRVRSGGFNLRLPSSYDYTTGQVGHERHRLSLAPSGREIDLEAAYTVRVLGGFLGTSLFYRVDPGHVEAMADDLGAAVRFTLGM
jgi:hypothetical protein